MAMTALNFRLEVNDEWPPIARECLPFEPVHEGYRCLQAPLFVRDLSVDDIIVPDIDEEGSVASWHHLVRSERTTIWLLRIGPSESIAGVVHQLCDLGCSSSELAAAGCYAIDVPGDVAIERVDLCLDSLDATSVAVAYPSFRHAE